MVRRVANGFVLSLLSCFWLGAAPGQTSDDAKMEKLLDQVDRPGSWPAMTPKTTAPATLPVNRFFKPGATTPQNSMPPNQTENQWTPRNILRVLLGAPPEGSKGTKSGSFSGARGNVEENLQAARDQASRARSACERASSGSDKDARMSAAEEARYAASAAREAADRASSQAENTTGDIAELAAQARGAADEAQSAADRATANAEGGGW